MRNTIVALWVYTGNHPNGNDYPRKGNFEVALAADAYYRVMDGDLVERVAPSRAGVKMERSDFGRTYAYRVKDVPALLAWYRTL